MHTMILQDLAAAIYSMGYNQMAIMVLCFCLEEVDNSKTTITCTLQLWLIQNILAVPGYQFDTKIIIICTLRTYPYMLWSPPRYTLQYSGAGDTSSMLICCYCTLNKMFMLGNTTFYFQIFHPEQRYYASMCIKTV